jgi:hypothetical protein
MPSTSPRLFCATLLVAACRLAHAQTLSASLTLKSALVPLAADRPAFWLSGNLDMANIARGMDFTDPVLIKLTQQVTSRRQPPRPAPPR